MSLYFNVGEQYRSLLMNGPPSSSYVVLHPSLVSMNSVLSDAIIVLNISWNLEQLIEVL